MLSTGAGLQVRAAGYLNSCPGFTCFIKTVFGNREAGGLAMHNATVRNLRQLAVKHGFRLPTIAAMHLLAAVLF